MGQNFIHHFLGASVILGLCTMQILAADSAKNESHNRERRSIVGQPCSEESTSCDLAYTVCNVTSKMCECDRLLSVATKMALFPEVTECIPLNYSMITGSCIPTIPDMCSVIAPGARCAVKGKATTRSMKCACAFGGSYPSCTIRIGTLCRFNETCQKDVKNSYCGDFVDGFGRCLCGGLEHLNMTFVANREGTECLPTNCAADPCRGDANASTCVDKAEGFECSCNENSKGRRHTFSSKGMCCQKERIPCDDFSKCIPIASMCDGTADCEDCSDERKFFCTGALPSGNLRCGSTRDDLVSTTAPTTTTQTTVVSQSNLIETNWVNNPMFKASQSFNPFMQQLQGAMNVNPGWSGQVIG